MLAERIPPIAGISLILAQGYQAALASLPMLVDCPPAWLVEGSGSVTEYDIEYWHEIDSERYPYREEGLRFSIGAEGHVCLSRGKPNASESPASLGSRFDTVKFWPQGVIIKERNSRGRPFVEIDPYQHANHFLLLKSALPVLAGTSQQDDLSSGWSTSTSSYAGMIGREWDWVSHSGEDLRIAKIDMTPLGRSMMVSLFATTSRIERIELETSLLGGEFKSVNDRYSWVYETTSPSSDHCTPTEIVWDRSLSRSDGVSRTFEKFTIKNIRPLETAPTIEVFSLRLAPEMQIFINGTMYKLRKNIEADTHIVPMSLDQLEATVASFVAR